MMTRRKESKHIMEYIKVTNENIEMNGGTDMIGLAVVCTILGGIVGASLEPVSFSVSIPIAIMGGFIMKEIRDRKDEK